MYAQVNETGKVLSILATNDSSLLDESFISMDGLSDWQISNNAYLNWNGSSWDIDASMPIELPPIDPKQLRHDRLIAGGFTEEQVTQIMLLDNA